MSDKKFFRIFAAIIITGVLCAAVLTGYTEHLRRKCSIITYISNEVSLYE